MSTGKIKTLFSDKEKTEVLFPRTKTSAVSNSEGKGLDAILENLPYFSDADSSKVANVPLNADTLGGHPISDFALAYDVENMTYEDVGAAPANLVELVKVFGIGIDAIEGIPDSNLDTVSTNGLFKVLNGNVVGFPSNYMGEWAFVLNLNYEPGHALFGTQVAWDMNGFVTCQRYKRNGVWSSWGLPNTSAFAPAGFGLGEYAKFLGNLSAISDLDNILSDGWYSFKLPNAQYAGIWMDYCHMRVDTFDNASCRQTFYPVNPYGTILHRQRRSATWGELECINPPMTLGVEYRTTERWNGKPVYCKLIDGGYLPNTGTKSYKVAENAGVFSVDGTNIRTVSLGGNIASTLQSDQVVSCYIGGDTVYISCGGDRSNIPFNFTAKYTKTTD